MLQSSIKPSNWPFFMSMSILNLPVSGLMSMTFSFTGKIFFSCLLVWTICMCFWLRDVFRESIFLGEFSLFMQLGFKIGMVFFIFSELMFFFSIFWTYFHFLFMFSGELGFFWPLNANKINIFSIPLLNTMLLLSSGMSLAISHNFKSENNYPLTSKYLNITMLLGMIFLLLQLWEYFCLDFLMSDSSYGSIFFLGTGFHGSHVLIGLLMLLFCLKQLPNTSNKSIFFDLASWYWHFVDMIWIFLYCVFYWWSF